MLVRAKTRTSRTYIWEVPNVREVPKDSDFLSPSFRPGTKTRTSKVRVVGEVPNDREFPNNSDFRSLVGLLGFCLLVLLQRDN